MLTIYNNEWLVLKDMIKNDFNKKYKNLNLNINGLVENDLLIKVNIRVSDLTLDIAKNFDLDLKGFFTISSFIDYLFINIDDSIKIMINEHYFK